MKKYSFIALMSAVSLTVSAQAEFDALRYSQSDITGTARYVSMSGAFGALGGDMSAISLNPAGIGVYRSSEFSFSPSYQQDKANTNYEGSLGEASSIKLLMNGVGYVGSFRTYDESAISNFNFGITYNRVADFNRKTQVYGVNRPISLLDRVNYVENDMFYQDGSHPDHTSFYKFLNGVHVIGLNSTGDAYESPLQANETLNSSMFLEESGGIDSWNFTLGANYNHSLYVGIGLGIQTIRYDKYSTYREEYELNGGTELRNTLTTTGSGVDFKAGVIYKPIPELRLGLSVHSGTYYSLTDVYNASMASWGFINPSTNAPYSPDPLYEGTEQYVDYILQTPWQMTFSAAYQFGNRGLLSLDVDYVDNRNTKMLNSMGYEMTDINYYIENDFQESYNIRLGGEMRLNDNFSARLGAAYYMSPMISNLEIYDIATAYTMPDYSIVKSTMYASLGAGYREGAFFMDVALQDRISNEHFFNFCEIIVDNQTFAPTYSNLTRDRLSLVMTAGFKF